MNAIVLIGNFGYLTNQLDGQTVKTRNIYALLDKRYTGKLRVFDTSVLRKKPVKVMAMFWRVIISNTIIVVPASAFLSVLFPIIYFITKLLGKDLIHLGVGGWQKEFFSGNGNQYGKHIGVMKKSRKIKGFLVEIDNVRKDLVATYGFKNIEVFPNFRFFDYEPSYETKVGEIRLVYMGRIMRKKGYEILFNMMKLLKKKNVNASLVLYGQIDNNDEEHFIELVATDNRVVYGGALAPNDIYQTLGRYDVMLFPTRFYTEGFPGTVLDAYIAGIPVIATNWKHATEFVKAEKSGYIVDFEHPLDGFVDKIEFLYNHPDMLQTLKLGAHDESYKYNEESAWNIIKKYIY